MYRVGVAAYVVALLACGRHSFEQHHDANTIDTTMAGDGDAPADAALPGTMGRAFVKASNTDPNDQFGLAVAVSGDGLTLAVGAPLEASGATTINGTQTDNTAPEAGAVYVYRRTADDWAQEAYVKPSNAEAIDQFGWAVALSHDGNTLAVGARREDSSSVGVNSDQTNNGAVSSGAAYVFVRSGTTWTQQAYVKATNSDPGDAFGQSLALSADGNTLAVGAPREDSGANAIGGNQANNLSMDAGAVYIYTRAGTQWSPQTYIKPSNTDVADEFGWDVALSETGDTLVVSAPREDSTAIGIGGDQADNSAVSAGAVYVFTRSGTTWTQRAYVKAPNTGAGDNFGYGLGVASSGMRIAVSAPSEASSATGIGGDANDETASLSGAIYVLDGGGATWTHRAYIKASNTELGDQLGFCLTLAGAGAVVVGGATDEDSASTSEQTNNAATSAGAGYIYSFDGASWTPARYVKATNPGANDFFGWACSVSAFGSTLAISAPFEDSSAVGVDGTPNEAAADSGAVYLFY